MFLVYECLYGELLEGNDSVNLIGLYDSKEKAFKKAKEIIDREKQEGNYILDIERKALKRDSFVRFFYGWQENWNNFFEVCVSKLDVE